MDFLSSNEIVGTIGLLFFFLMFVGVVLWVFRPGSKKKYKRWGHIPLDDEDEK